MTPWAGEMRGVFFLDMEAAVNEYKTRGTSFTQDSQNITIMKIGGEYILWYPLDLDGKTVTAEDGKPAWWARETNTYITFYDGIDGSHVKSRWTVSEEFR